MGFRVENSGTQGATFAHITKLQIPTLYLNPQYNNPEPYNLGLERYIQSLNSSLRVY